MATLKKTAAEKTPFRSARDLLHLCAFCLAMLGPLAACAEEDMKTYKWREEVKLSNGNVIVADQMETFRTKEEALRRGALLNNYRIEATFPAPASTTVVWEGHLWPLALDISPDGQIYLVTVVQTRQGRLEYSVPGGVYHVAFKYRGASQWERIPIESVPHEFKPNLFMGINVLFIKQGYDTSKLVDLALKEKIDSDPREFEWWFRSWQKR